MLVLAAGASGLSARAAAARFNVGIATAIRWLRRERETSERTARRQGKPRGSRLDAHETFIFGLLEARREITLVEIAARLREEHAVEIGRSMLSRWLLQRGWSFKKRPPMHWSRNAQPDLDPDRLVFIDETSLSTKMARMRGRALRGERCRTGVPHGHWKTTIFTGALRTTGLTAPFVHDGAMNGIVFQTYVERVLVPILRPRDVVILNNLPAHRMPGARRSIEQAGASMRFLPGAVTLTEIKHATACSADFRQ